MTPHAHKKLEYLREFEFILEKGPRTDVLMKKPRVENLVALSL
jgi:hypothetical protein